ncbi:DNA polymerase III subunit gamma/tau [bacterium]|nr:DNA polymerase III subunit gamma/tau [bacterium]
MFYRKYRPQNFSQVNGNSEIKTSLINTLVKGKLPHAFLFSGPRGTGKTTLARILAKSLACESFTDNNDACCKCDTCLSLQSGRYADLIEIDAASNNSVENIRDLNDKVALAPTHGKFKFYIIDEVHMLSKGAFNALLKTLEEPPKNTYFVLATTEPDKVPATIKSRCQLFTLKPAKNEDIVLNLKRILKEEKKELTEKDLLQIARASKGGYRDAVTMLEQVIVGGLSVKDVINTEGLEFTIRFFEQVLTANTANCINLIDDYAKSGNSLENWNKEILFYLRQVILLQNNLVDLCEIETNLLSIASDQAKLFSRQILLKSLKAFSESLENIKYAYVPTLPIEVATLEVIDLIHPEEIYSSNSNGSPSLDDVSPKVDNTDTKSSTKKSTADDVKKTENSKKEASVSKSTAVNESSKKVLDQLDDLQKLVDSQKAEAEPVAQLPIVTTTVGNFSWGEFTERVQDSKPSLSTALNACRYIGFNEKVLIIEASFSFHKERIDLRGTKDFLIKILNEYLDDKYDLQCNLQNNANTDLTDKNVEYVTISETEVPTGPIKQAKDDFAAPTDDPNFVPSNVSDKLSGTGDTAQDFGGDFNV